MDFIVAPIEAVRDFLELGGDVLSLITVTIFAMWVLIVERLIFFRTGLIRLGDEQREQWRARPDRKSWGAQQIREAMISRYSMSANRVVPVIQTLVALCPLLGLMGTVTGMIEVFDVMAISGTGNARSMASGVSKATIPTMAGMVGALSGVFLVTIITRLIETKVEGLEEDLELDH
ncbi:MAG: MotA/TolQ/ExbB proton channel family protein [Gammaproteobacteria bacterium]|jgi:biopolymer transport protein ExbB|nr:MotA/TolQ/ExbB proton channel family protein [Gammaproteobacteria bacterium]MDP6615944.1 MotA/TolQ/ExbB proton channel family protein [Gammaproteobacteria bacterium]MDP6695017.1 MotA/TolQ/ExbB proton channel family protein [Gammaproteobacteria bacterium]